jgi:hypothetical protein
MERPGPYTDLGRAFLTPLLALPRFSYPTSSVVLRFTPLKRCARASVVRSCPSPVGWAQLFLKRGNNFLLFATPASLIGSELSRTGLWPFALTHPDFLRPALARCNLAKLSFCVAAMQRLLVAAYTTS